MNSVKNAHPKDHGLMKGCRDTSGFGQLAGVPVAFAVNPRVVNGEGLD
ncbi:MULTISPECIES: hypothetical protein [unclassified Streptomyces]|nr:hypothetical protein [Streptomyces sp. WAC05374]